MLCPHCQREIPDPATPAEPARRLARPTTSRKIAGVCAGFAEYFDVDVTVVRTLWVVLSIVPGAVVGGVIAYLLAWLLMPESTAATQISTARTRLVRSAADKKIAGVCGGIAEYFGVDSTPIRLLWVVLSVLPGCLLGGILAYIGAWIIMPKPPVVVAATTNPASHAA